MKLATMSGMANTVSPTNRQTTTQANNQKMVETLKRKNRIYAYDAPTYSSAIVDLPILWQRFPEIGDTRLSTTTTIGFFNRDPSYNSDSRRVTKQTPTSSVKFVWDPVTDAYLTELDGSNILLATYTQEPIQFGRLVSQRRSSISSWYHTDALGSWVYVASRMFEPSSSVR